MLEYNYRKLKAGAKMNYKLDLLYKDSLCELISSRGEILSTGIISEITPETVTIIPKNDKLIYFNSDDKTIIRIYNAELETVVIKGTVKSSSLGELTLGELTTVSHKEKRDYFRLNIHHPAIISTNEEFTNPIRAKIWDISLSGIAISVASDIDPTDCHFIRFNIIGETLVLEFKIIRETTSYYTPLENKYGCRFLNLTNIQTDKLCNFIFAIQRNQLKGRYNP